MAVMALLIGSNYQWVALLVQILPHCLLLPMHADTQLAMLVGILESGTMSHLTITQTLKRNSTML